MRWNQNSRIMNSSIIKEFTEYFSGGQILLKFKTNFEANLRYSDPQSLVSITICLKSNPHTLSRACRFVNTQAATVKIGKGSRSFDYPLSLLPPFCKKHLESSRWINLHQAHAYNIIKSRRNFKNVLLVLFRTGVLLFETFLLWQQTQSSRSEFWMSSKNIEVKLYLRELSFNVADYISFLYHCYLFLK